MFRDLFNFRGINWWTFLGGMGLNFIISIGVSIFGAYLAENEASAGFYAQFGAPLMVLLIFLGCMFAGWITGKISWEYPLKHAFLTSIGAFAPLTFSAVMTFNPMLLMLAVVAVAGCFNGGMLATPKPKGPIAKG